MFSIILPSRPCLTSLQPLPNSPNQFAFSFPLHPHFSHIVVFLIPGNTLPPNTAAGVYLQLPGQDFRFLGAIANDKQSAIFKVNLPTQTPETAGLSGSDVNVGISVEHVANIQSQITQLHLEQPQQSSAGKPSTKVLAQRIIQNAFNFLAGFSGRVGEGGVEVVPLKSFEDWWRKFERKVEMDPGFLEKDQG